MRLITGALVALAAIVGIAGVVGVASVATAQESTPTLSELASNIKALAGRLNDLGRKVDANRTAWENSNLRIADKVAANQRENAELRAALANIYPPYFPAPAKGTVNNPSRDGYGAFKPVPDVKTYLINHSPFGLQPNASFLYERFRGFRIEHRVYFNGQVLTQRPNEYKPEFRRTDSPALNVPTGIAKYDYRYCWGHECTPYSAPLYVDLATWSEVPAP